MKLRASLQRALVAGFEYRVVIVKLGVQVFQGSVSGEYKRLFNNKS